jgi:hypothetical protein
MMRAISSRKRVCCPMPGNGTAYRAALLPAAIAATPTIATALAVAVDLNGQACADFINSTIDVCNGKAAPDYCSCYGVRPHIRGLLLVKP